LEYSETRRSCLFIDLDAWPPNPNLIDDEYVTSFDLLPDARFVVCSMLTKPASEYAVRIHPPGWPSVPTAGPPEVVAVPDGVDLAEVVTVQDQVVAFRSLVKRDAPPESWRAYRLQDSELHPVPELPEVQSFGADQYGHQSHDNGKVTLTDGTDLLIWDGNGYQLQRGRFERTWELAAKHSVGLGGWTAVPWGDDGLIYLSDRRVMYARRGCDPAPVMPDADNVMFLSPGPEDSVIASHGKNRKSLAARVWFPADGSYIPVTRKELGVAPHFRPAELYWSAVTRQVYTTYGGLLKFPDSDLLALKRVRPRGGGYTASR
jgi:hypothetical protein